MAYHGSLEADWKGKASVRRFPYASSASDVLDLPACKITSSVRTAKDVRGKKWVEVVSVVFKSGKRKTSAEDVDADSSVVAPSVDFPVPALDVCIAEREIVEGSLPWNISALTSKDDRKTFTLRRIQERCQTYALLIPSDIRCVQGKIIDALEAYASAGGD